MTDPVGCGSAVWIANGFPRCSRPPVRRVCNAGSGRSRRCRVARSSVHRWLGRYGAGGDATALADRPRSGGPRQSGTLTPRRLAAALARDPRRCGYRATSWTVPLLAHYLAAHDGIVVSVRTLRRRLHEAGYRWERPRPAYRQRAAHLAQKKGAWSDA